MTIVVSTFKNYFLCQMRFHPILKTCCNVNYIMIKTVIIIFDQVHQILIELSYNERTSVFGVEAKFSRRQLALCKRVSAVKLTFEFERMESCGF